MSFKERLRELRLRSGLTQAELAKKIEVSERTIQNYEMGKRRPQNFEIVSKMAEALGTTSESLLGATGGYVVEAAEKGGSQAAKDIDQLVNEVTGLFAGGELSEDALEGAMKALNDAYWLAKEKNKKYTPKKYRKSENL